MQINQIRNATLIITYGNKRFLIDPWLGPKDYMPGFEGAYNSDIRQPRIDLPVDITDIVNVDAVILTHYHPDHWDNYAAEALDKNIQFVFYLDNDLNIIKSLGFKNVSVISENGTIYENITFYKTQCQHGRREVVKPACESMGIPYDAMGVVFNVNNEKTLYLAGDTIWCNEVQSAIDNFKPEIIIVNACGARLLNNERLIMDTEDLKAISAYTKSSTIVASHLDTVSHLTVTRDDIKKLQLDNVVIPENNEILNF